MESDHRKTLLLVEDEVLIAMAKKQELEKYEYNVLTVDTGEKAIDLSKRNMKIDLILMDIDLGEGIDGTIAAELILKKQDIPVVFMSSHTEPEIIKKTEKITSYGYVVKNSCITVLDASIRMAFKLFEAKKELNRRNMLIKAGNENLRVTVEELETSRKRLASIFRAAPTGIGVVVNRIIVEVNNKFTDLTGYREDELIGNAARMLYPTQEEYEYVGTEKYKQIKLKGTGTVETQLKCKDGKIIDVLLSSTPLDINDLGKGVTFTALDITGFKKIENKLLRNQYLQTKAQEMGNIGAWELDIQQNIVRWTDETYKIFGMQPGTEIDNDIFLSFIHPDDREYADKKWEAGLKEGSYEIEHRIVVEDRVKWVKEKIEFDYNKKGKPLMAIGFTQDITQRKHSEEKLKMSELRFRTMFDKSPMGISLTDSQTGQFYEVNFMFAKILGKTLEEMKHSDWMHITHPDDIQKDLDKMELMNTGEITGFQMEKRYLREDGTILWVNITITRIFVEDKTHPRHLCMIEDISQRKQAEEEIIRQLSEKEIILKEVHHRIKNNFASIESLISLQAQSDDNPEIKSALNIAGGRVNSMRILYENLLLTENYQTISVKEYLNKLTDIIINLVPDTLNISMEKHLDDIQLDSKILFPIGLIVNELLTNIIKYAFTGRDSGLIELILKASDREITLILQDNGNGLPDGFDINKPKGFGLMLIRILSEQLGGSFSIENNNGTKSILNFNL